MRSVKLLLYLAFLWPASFAAAQSGKIAGTVTDANTQDPLPGVNVVIVGTTIGATTDVDGFYNILNVRPGLYEVRASFVGYTTQVIQRVEVNIDLTTELNFELQSETVGLEEVVVEARTPIIQQDIGASQRNIGSEEIQTGLYQNVTTVVNAQVGVVAIGAYEDRPRIRGSSFDEALFLVDGISQGDGLTNRPFFRVNLDAVDEVKLQTGGFSAEYGNVRSGVVSVVTKEGREMYSGSINFNYSAPGIKHFGPMMFGFDSPVSQPFVDPMMGAFTGYMMNEDGSFKVDGNGEKIPNPFDSQGWKGWDAVSQDQASAGPHTGNPMELYARWLWRHRSQDSIDELRRLEKEGLVQFAPGVNPDDQVYQNYGSKPDYRASATLGGPIPGLNAVKFFASYDAEQTEYSGGTPQPAYEEQNARLKLSTRVFGTTKVNLHGYYGIQSGSDGGQGPGIDGFISNNPFRAMDGSPNKMWYPHCAVPGEQQRGIYGLQVVHTSSSNTFYQVDLTHSRSDYNMLQDQRNTAPIPGSPYGLRSLKEGIIGTEAEANARAAAGEPGWENWRDWARIRIGDVWYDEAPFGYQPDQFRDETGEYRMASCNLRLNDTNSRVYDMNARMTSQVNRYNQVKIGLQVKRESIFQDYIALDPSVNGGAYWTSDATPWTGALFAEDKIEYRGLVATLGLRADWIVNGEFPVLLNGAESDTLGGPYSNLLLPGREDDFNQFPTEQLSDFLLSPRLMVSHPIGTSAKIYFNYGHFYQWPNLFSLYRVERSFPNVGRVNRIGNPKLEPPRTIQYEVGLEQNLIDKMLLRLSGYYKDINNEYNDVRFYPIFYGGSDYRMSYNNEFRDVRGLEAFLELRRDVVPFVSGWGSVNYLVESGGLFGYDRFYQDPTQQPRQVSSEVSNPDVRPIIKLNLDFHTPADFGPGTSNFSLLGGIDINLLYTWQRGPHFTWNPAGFPLVENNVRWRPYQRWDLRLTKELFTRGQTSASFYIDVRNLFNTKNMTRNTESLVGGWAWDSHKWWKQQFQGYLESLGYTAQNQNEDGSFNTSRRPGDYEGDDIALPGFTPMTFLERRDIFFGIRFSF